MAKITWTNEAQSWLKDTYEYIAQDADSAMKKEYDFSKGKRGPVAKTTGKTRITIYLDDDIIAAFREKGDELGRGYQTLINDALREALSTTESAVDAKTLRRIIREELKKVG